MYKGAQSLDLHKTSAVTAASWALGLGGGVALLVIPTALPVMKKNVTRIYNEDGTLKVVSVLALEVVSVYIFDCLELTSSMLVLRRAANGPRAPARNEDEVLEDIECGFVLSWPHQCLG